TASQCSSRASSTAQDLSRRPDPTPAVNEAPTTARRGAGRMSPRRARSSSFSQPVRDTPGGRAPGSCPGRWRVDTRCGEAEGDRAVPCAEMTGSSARAPTAPTAAITMEYRRATAQCQPRQGACQTKGAGLDLAAASAEPPTAEPVTAEPVTAEPGLRSVIPGPAGGVLVPERDVTAARSYAGRERGPLACVHSQKGKGPPWPTLSSCGSARLSC